MSKTASQLYQKTADTLRKAASEQLNDRDPAHTLITLAANQLENAADTAMMLENLIYREGIAMPNNPPRNSGQWEKDRAADVSQAYRRGFLLGFGVCIALALITTMVLK